MTVVFLSEVPPDYPERIRVCGPRRFFQPGCVGRCPVRLCEGPVELATEVKVLPPLIGRGVPRSTEGYCGWIGSGSDGFPKMLTGLPSTRANIPEATIGLIKKDHTKYCEPGAACPTNTYLAVLSAYRSNQLSHQQPPSWQHRSSLAI